MTSEVLPIWWDGAADGPTNMAADEVLADEARRHGGLVIRFYSWTEPTVSLGGFQRLADARACSAIAGLPIVRRPSGGGAIVHGTDLTYAAAVPRSHAWGTTPQVFYDAMHSAMVAALAEFGIETRLHAPACDDPPADALLCFSRRSPGDLVLGRRGQPPAATDPKVMGSAQRRFGAAVLQHGSLLLASCPAVASDHRHPGLADLAPAPHAWTSEAIADRWTGHLANTLEIARKFLTAPFSAGRDGDVLAAAARFRDERWTGRR